PCTLHLRPSRCGSEQRWEWQWSERGFRARYVRAKIACPSLPRKSAALTQLHCSFYTGRGERDAAVRVERDRGLRRYALAVSAHALGTRARVFRATRPRSLFHRTHLL